jgi:hypothetical protein
MAAQAEELDGVGVPSALSTMHVGGGAVDTPSDALVDVHVAEHALQGSPPCQYTVGQATALHTCTLDGLASTSHKPGSTMVWGPPRATQCTAREEYPRLPSPHAALHVDQPEVCREHEHGCRQADRQTESQRSTGSQVLEALPATQLRLRLEQ